jgi:hypothetical protein
LPKASSGESLSRTRSGVTAGAREQNASKKERRLDLFRFVPFRLNRLAAEVSAALASEYQERYGLDIPEWRVLATLGFRNEDDRREFRLRMTKKGNALYEQLIPRLLRKEQEILSCLSAREQKDLAAMLGKIEQSLDLVQTSSEADAKQAY